MLYPVREEVELMSPVHGYMIHGILSFLSRQKWYWVPHWACPYGHFQLIPELKVAPESKCVPKYPGQQTALHLLATQWIPFPFSQPRPQWIVGPHFLVRNGSQHRPQLQPFQLQKRKEHNNLKFTIICLDSKPSKKVRKMFFNYSDNLHWLRTSTFPSTRKLRLHSCFSDSLIIHKEKTNKIPTMTVVWISDTNYHKILQTLSLNFSKN